MGAIILRLPEVKNRTGLSRSAIYEKIADGTFPKQLKLGCKSSGWILSEIDQWINDRIAERDAARDAA